LRGSSSCSRVKARCKKDKVDFSHFNLENPSKTSRLTRRREFFEPTQAEMDIIVGSLLGDGTLGKIYGERAQANFEEGHGVKQKDYLFWKYEELKRFFKKEPYEQMRPKIAMGDDGKIYRLNVKEPCWIAKSFRCPLLTQLEREWYMRDDSGNYVYRDNRRIKIIPNDLVLNPRIIGFTVGELVKNTILYKCTHEI